MTTDVIRFGFVAGEVAPSFYGRADLEKYDLALAEAENWYIDYHGGLSNCQGTTLVDFIENAEAGFRFFPFKFSDSLANKYLIIFGSGYIRFVQDGSYVLETAKAVTAISQPASTAQLTVPLHGYSTGDLVSVITPGNVLEMAAQTYKITVASSNAFTLLDMFDNPVPYSTFTAYTGGMTVGRVYTISNPYAAADFADLKTQQVRDVIRVTHPSYKIYNLVRNAHTSWTISQESLARPTSRPSFPTVTVVNTGNYSVGYMVAAVDADGNEGLPSDLGWTEECADIETVKDSTCTASWSAVAGTDYYNVYRTRVVYQGTGTSQMSRIFQVGYIGRARGTRFVDNGITPDFTKTPLRNVNPFARKAIKYINILTGGSGFGRGATMTVTDATGTGFIGYPVVVGSAIVGFNILDGGENYTNPTFTFSSGTGFTCTVELSDAADTDPSVSALYQQRQIYAGPRGRPLSIYGSKPGKLSDFSISDVLLSSDSFSHELDSDNFSPIRHLIPTRGGIVVMSSAGIWLLSGSSSGAITATDVQADLNVFTGVSDVVPIKIDTDILYISATGGRVNSLAYNDQYKLYSPTDVSLLSNHLLKDYSISKWAYADEPHRMTYAVREDGVMLLFTMIKDQEIFGWTRRVTKGYFKDVMTFDGDGDTDVYFAVRRFLNGEWVTAIERLATAKPRTVEDSVFLDCSLSIGVTYPATTMQLDALTGDAVTMRLGASYLTNDHVGQVVRFGNGKAKITEVLDSTQATVKIYADFDETMNYTNTPREALAREWSLDKEYKTVSGLWHLEGEIVTALADGNVIQNLVVQNGNITLPQYASRIVVGIPYKSIAKSLPLTVNGAVVEGKRRRVTSMALRVLETRGLKVGSTKDELYQLRTQLAQTLGEASPMYTGITHVSIEPVWSDEAQQYFVQEYPLPATILGYILEADVGDG